MLTNRLGILGFAVLFLAALFNVAALNMAEQSLAALKETASWVRHTLVARNSIEHLYRLVVDAETGQRGYLLTRDSTYLTPYLDAQRQVAARIAELRELVGSNPVQAAQLVTAGPLLEARFAQMERTLAQAREQGNDAPRNVLLSPAGQVTMDALRLVLDGMVAEERTQYDRRFLAFAQNQNRIRWGFFVEVGINLFLVTLGGMFLAHDVQRRRREAKAALDHNAELARAVQERTSELTDLSHYLQRMQEDEKAKIAREIHDELGGTLAAAKIDLQLLADKLPADDPRQTRIARVMAGIDDAVQVKRRIIEDLRPTILDNLGIGAALRWQCGEFAKRVGVPCRVELHDEDLRLSPAYSIAFYRVVQEALTNAGKYAQAANVAVSLRRAGDTWILRIADDGVGIDTARCHHLTAHGLVSMRERVRALGGEFSIKGQPGRGTLIEIRVPVETGPSPTAGLIAAAV